MEQPPSGDEVGYGKPPKQHRFKKGQSGNPRGRPKGAKNKGAGLPNALNVFNEILTQAFEKPVSVLADGKREPKPSLQFIVERVVAGAARGDFGQQKLVLSAAKAWAAQNQKEKSERIGMAEAYKAEWGPRFAAAIERGLPEPSALPHPSHLHFLVDEFDAFLSGPLNSQDEAAWDQQKGALRWLDGEIESECRKLGSSRETPALHQRIGSCDACYGKMRRRFQQVGIGASASPMSTALTTGNASTDK